VSTTEKVTCRCGQSFDDQRCFLLHAMQCDRLAWGCDWEPPLDSCSTPLATHPAANTLAESRIAASTSTPVEAPAVAPNQTKHTNCKICNEPADLFCALCGGYYFCKMHRCRHLSREDPGDTVKVQKKEGAKALRTGFLLCIYILSVCWFLGNGNGAGALIFPPFIVFVCAVIIMIAEGK